MKRSNWVKVGSGKNWTREEDEYLSEKWGTISVKGLAKHLGRSEYAVLNRRHRLGLGGFLESGDYITFNQLLIALGVDSGGYKTISWIQNRDFPIHSKRVKEDTFRVIYIDEFWEWAEKNKSLLDFSKMESNILGAEPAWVKEKRKHDVERARKYITTPWTKTEDEKLKYLVEKRKYTYDELSKKLRRTNGAIQRRLLDLDIKERPIKAENHTRWTNKDFQKMGELIKEGYGYDLLAEEIGKSSKACRGRVYQMYLTENLDKVREYMGDGNFGDNRPERKIRQWNAMNTEERIEAKDKLTELAAIFQWRFQEEIKATEWGEFFQKDMCVNFCSDCLETEGCDSCLNYKKIEPQNCKMCGKTFFERKSNLYCAPCRDARKRQWLRKRFVLAGRN